MITSPLSKLVNFWTYNLQSDPNVTWVSDFVFDFGANWTFETIATLPISVQHDDSQLHIDLGSVVYQYGGQTSMKIYVDDVLVRTIAAGVYISENRQRYYNLSGKIVINTISRGPHTIKITGATNHAADAQIYKSVAEGSYFTLTVSEIRK